MPLSELGIIQVSKRQKIEEQEFAKKFGVEKLQEKLDSEGAYAYGFSDKVTLRTALDQMHELSEECLYGKDQALKSKYINVLQDRFGFPFSLYPSLNEKKADFLVIEKPFPKPLFDKKLTEIGLEYWEVGVYRLGELSEDEIVNHLGGGVLWFSYCHIDLSEKLAISRLGL